jgi:hypothetical protein
MMLLDGVASSDIDNSHSIEYALQCRIFGPDPEGSRKAKVLETIELGPESDGLCGSYHGWLHIKRQRIGLYMVRGV